MGVTMWESAQPVNDLVGMKKKYDNLTIIGGWDSQGPAAAPGASEELVRQSVHEAIDKFAPGGRYVFWDFGPVGNSEDMTNKISWLEDEARTYGREFYKK